MKGSVWVAAAILALAPGRAFAGSVEDDLAVVKKAVAGQNAAAPGGQAGGRDESEAPAKADKMRWLKVRVVEKAGKRVSINLPLSVARALGDEWPVNLNCRRNGSRVTLGAVLRNLEAGQDLVQIDSDEASVRVWVE